MDQIRKILIVILEPQDKTSTETNYFQGFKNHLKDKKWEHLFNKNIDNIIIQKIKLWKKSENKKNKKIIRDCKEFIFPDAVYGIVDNDCKTDMDLIKSTFKNLVKSINCKNEYKKIILPPENMNFEYFIALHILEKSKISLNQLKINSYLEKYFNEDLSKIKSNDKIFDKLLENGTNLLLDNIKLHPNCHNDAIYFNCDNGGECDPHCHKYSELVEILFQK